MNRQIVIGQLVRSLQGRDCGAYYLVEDISTDGKILFLVDGRKRTATNQKKKNAAHVQIVHKISHELAKRKVAGAPLTDEEIRRFMIQLGIDLG